MQVSDEKESQGQRHQSINDKDAQIDVIEKKCRVLYISWQCRIWLLNFILYEAENLKTHGWNDAYNEAEIGPAYVKASVGVIVVGYYMQGE